MPSRRICAILTDGSRDDVLPVKKGFDGNRMSRFLASRPHAPGFWLLLAGLLFSLLLGGFGVSNYRSARPIAEGMLRGLALTLVSTIEALANQDASFSLLRRVNSPDIAFCSVCDEAGIQVFHTNPDLIGSPIEPHFAVPDFTGHGFHERRITLGTGEKAFEFLAPAHVDGRLFVVRLVLHTYQADAVVRRSRAGLAALGALLAAGWVMGAFLYAHARRAARHRQEMAEQRHLAQLGTLSAVLAHEVRNPLSGIKGYAQLLEETLDREQERDFAHEVVTEAVRLEGLVNDLLVYAQPSAVRVESVDLGEAVEHVFVLVGRQAAAGDVRLVRAPDGWPRVRADADRLRQILLNLLLNAIQATPPGGLVTVAARRRGKRVEVVIKDSGRGIAPEDLPRIFEPFFTRRARGTGLGLALCKKFVEEMGGRIEVASAPGQGSVFTLVLSVAGDETRSEA